VQATYKEVRQAEAGNLVNVAFSTKEHILREGTECPSDFDPRIPVERRTGRVTELQRQMWDALALKLDSENAVEFGETVDRRIVYPALPGVDAELIDNGGLVSLALRNQVSHFVFGNEQLMRRLKILTEELVPHVAVMVSGKSRPGTWQIACAKAMRGAQVMLLKNTGLVLNDIVRTVERERHRLTNKGEDGKKKKNKDPVLAAEEEAAAADEAKLQEVVERMQGGSYTAMEMPAQVNPSHFMIFDAITDMPDKVIEKLTSALASSSAEGMHEMGFAATEMARMQYAWELCALFRYNATLLENRARFMHFMVTFVGFSVTITAVLLSAGNELCQDPADYYELQENDPDMIWQVQECIELSPWFHTSMALGCTIVPMISAFLLALSQKFNYATRWAQMTVAGERVCSEIYLYRTRVGDYKSSKKNAKLAALFADGELAGGTRGGGGGASSSALSSDPGSPSVNQNSQLDSSNEVGGGGGGDSNKSGDGEKKTRGPHASGREIFQANLMELLGEVQGSDFAFSSLSKPKSKHTKKLIYDKLYPFDAKKRGGLSTVRTRWPA
jgi:hypothetical protein